MDVRIGILTPGTLDERARDALAAAGDAGLDHVGSVDHVSFRGGDGVDSLVTVAAMAGLHPTLGLHTSVYLLTLRHPVVVARQLSTVAHMAPGRLVFGVGIGGEDRHEVEVCGIDPRTRGRRMDEHLTVLRALLTGEPVTFHGESSRSTRRASNPRRRSRSRSSSAVGPTPPPAVRDDSAKGGSECGPQPDDSPTSWRSWARRPTESDAATWSGATPRRSGAHSARTVTRSVTASPPRWSTTTACRSTRSRSTRPTADPRTSPSSWCPTSKAGAGTINAISVAAHLDEAIEGVAALKELLVS